MADRKSGHGVAPARRNGKQRRQYEVPLAKSRVGNAQRAAVPATPGPQDDVDVQPPRPPAPEPLAAQSALYRLQAGKHLFGRQGTLHQHRAIDEDAPRRPDRPGLHDGGHAENRAQFRDHANRAAQQACRGHPRRQRPVRSQGKGVNMTGACLDHRTAPIPSP